MGPYYDYAVMMTLPLETRAANRPDAGSWRFERGAAGRLAARIWNWAKPRSNDYPATPANYATGWDWDPRRQGGRMDLESLCDRSMSSRQV